jgi:hypothetical protein
VAAPQIPYTIEAKLSFPPDEGLPAAVRSAMLAGNYTKVACAKYSLTGAGTQVVDFASIASPGAKAILMEYNNDDPQAGLQPVNVSINAGTDLWEISPGGHLSYSNPNPTAGITAMSIAYTSEARINIWILG